MKKNSVRQKTPVSYYGGKQQLQAEIQPRIPEHRVYTESFAGGLATFFAKEPSKVEVINDLDGSIVNFYEVLKLEYLKLYELVQTTLHSRHAYEDSLVIYKYPHLFTKARRAWAFWVLTNQGFASKIGSWGYDKSSGSSERKIQNRKLTFGLHLAKRLEDTQIECNNALKVIQSRDCPDAFHFVDPPYFNSNCGHYGGYSLEDFTALLELLSTIQGKFLLCSYDSDVLSDFVEKFGWKQIKKQMPVSADKSKKKQKVEVITMNY